MWLSTSGVTLLGTGLGRLGSGRGLGTRFSVVFLSGFWGRFASGDGVSQFALQVFRVEGETGGATLESWVSSDTKPITSAGFLDRDGAVSGVFADRMLLAVGNVVGPVTSMGSIVVEKGERTLLVGGRAVPALPVTCARRGVGENSVFPVAVVGTFGTLAHYSVVFVRTSNLVWVVTILQQTLLLAGER